MGYSDLIPLSYGIENPALKEIIVSVYPVDAYLKKKVDIIPLVRHGSFILPALLLLLKIFSFPGFFSNYTPGLSNNSFQGYSLVLP